MTTTIEVHGACDSRFAAVQEAFAANFTDFGEVGASLAVTLEGRPVVDIWAGYADAARTRPWQRDTIANVYSTTKGMTAICAHHLVDRGLLDLDAPVARYWPEFAQAGKDTLPVRYLLSHRAGLPAIAAPLPRGASFQWETMTSALAAQEPWWEPGTKHGYHAVTFGWLVGEVVRRISGRSPGTYFRQEIAEPLGLDFHIGLGPEHDARVAEMIPGPMPDASNEMVAAMLADPMTLKTLLNPPDTAEPGIVNTREWRAAEIPAANGHGNARALARVYGALACGGEVDGVGVLSREAIERAIVEQSYGPDALLRLPTRFGLGFFLTVPETPFGLGPRAFGHPGMGGSIGLADPDAGLGFGYVMNKMITGLEMLDPRWPPLIDAVYASAGR